MIKMHVEHISKDETLKITATVTKNHKSDPWELLLMYASVWFDGAEYNVLFEDKSDQLYFKELILEKAEAQVSGEEADKLYEDRKAFNEEQDND